MKGKVKIFLETRVSKWSKPASLFYILTIGWMVGRSGSQISYHDIHKMKCLKTNLGSTIMGHITLIPSGPWLLVVTLLTLTARTNSVQQRLATI